MLKPCRCTLIVLLLTAAAQAQTTVPPPSAAQTTSGLTAAQAAAALQVLQDPAKRAQLLDTLRAVAAAAPATPSASHATAPAAAAQAAAAAPKPAAPASKPASALTPNSLGAELLTEASDWIKGASHNVTLTARALTNFPALQRGLSYIFRHPAARERLAHIGGKLGLVLGCALVFEWLAVLAARRPSAALEASAPRSASDAIAAGLGAVPAHDDDHPARLARWHARLNRTPLLLRRLPWVLGHLALELLPVAIFVVAALLLLNSGIVDDIDTRLIILTAMNAYVSFRVIMCVTRMLISPTSARLRLLYIAGETAAYIEVWVRRIAVIMVFGIALSHIAVLLGLSLPAAHAVSKIVGLLAHLCLVIIVLQCRHAVAHVIRARPDQYGSIAVIRNGLADAWPYIAIFFIMAQWVIWAIAIPNGFSLLFQYFLATVAVLIVARLIAIIVLGALDRIFHISAEESERYPGLERRANRYYPVLRGAISAVIVLITIVALLEVWGVHALGWLHNDVIGRRLVSAVITVAIAAIAAVIVWEGANAAIDRRLKRKPALSSARLRTLVPVLRSALFIAVVTIVGLTALSEIGVNIAPLLAGAGIIGIAVGFGSQKLVQDVITGLFLLLEDAMQVGDFVTVSGLSGTVENLSIRTIRLRAEDGAVHLVPFSAVSSVTNTNRGVGNATISVSVALKENLDQVGDVLKSIASDMRAEPRFKSMILSDLQLWGVDKVGPSSATLLGQIVCTASGRWLVQREFNRRMKKRFQELGIELAAPP